MTTILEDKARTVVPRWRPSLVSALTGELATTGQARPALVTSKPFLADKLAEWRENPSVELAADLVSCALVLGATEEGALAARAILTDSSTATPAVKLIAKRLLYGWSPEEISARVSSAGLGPPEAHRALSQSRIRILKGELSDSPRNALKWADLAREYAQLAQGDKAFKAMERALFIAPNNRFLLRSSCRLYVHFDKPDKAHDILLRSQLTPGDPWLMAPEIVVASLTGHASKNIKKGIALTNSKRFSPRHISELASALATLNLDAGDFRMSRRHFRLSLKDPTDNALAQASWASRLLGGLELDPSLFDEPRTFEARAERFRELSEWPNVVNSSIDWITDEPYSSRPAYIGSYVSSVALQDFQLTESFSRIGLLANPEDIVLRNNLTYALASQDKVREAWLQFNKITRHNLTSNQKCMLAATEGLLRYRSGDPETGRALYESAIHLASEDETDRLRALAFLHLAREEARFDYSRSRVILEAAQPFLRASQTNEIKAFASILEQRLWPK